MDDAPVGTDGITAALMALTIGIIAKLRAKGLISTEEIADVIDQATLGLEEMGIAGPVQKAAHGTLMQFQAMFLGLPFPTQTEDS